MTRHVSSPSTVAVTPTHAGLMLIPFTCFLLAMIADIAYWTTVNLMWLNFSSWLLFAGLVAAGLVALWALVEHIARPIVRPATWVYVIGYLVTLCLALVDNLVHAADGWSAIVPYGMWLTVAVVVVLLITLLAGRARAAHIIIEGQRHV